MIKKILQSKIRMPRVLVHLIRAPYRSAISLVLSRLYGVAHGAGERRDGTDSDMSGVSERRVHWIFGKFATGVSALLFFVIGIGLWYSFQPEVRIIHDSQEEWTAFFWRGRLCIQDQTMHPKVLINGKRYYFGWGSFTPMYLSGCGVAVSVFPILIAASVLPVVSLVRLSSPYRRWYRRLNGLCISCAYNLTGNTSGICPECGTPIPKEIQEKLAAEPPSSNAKIDTHGSQSVDEQNV